MHKRFMLALVFIISFVALFYSVAHATSSGVVLSHIQAGGSGGNQPALQEFVIIYNNSSSDVEITNWCLENKSSVKFACFSPTGPSVHLWLSAHSYAVISSDAFNIQYSFTPDVSYVPTNQTSGSIVGSSDIIKLVDNTNTIVDSYSWLTAISGGQHFKRQFMSGSNDTLLDTDQESDFIKSSSITIPESGIYEVVIIVDLCSNIAGVQESLPPGYLIDSSSGLCEQDECLNLSGLQIEVPTDMEISQTGTCIYIDYCQNISGLQMIIPTGYVQDDYRQCFVDALAIKLNELLPNPEGKDAGSEFIELYNPTDFTVSLDLYKFSIGVDVIHSYIFPIGAVIEPHGYYVVYNSQISFTLNNSSSKVSLDTVDNQNIDSSDVYTSAKEGESWAMIDGLWQFTNQLTPGSFNLASIESEVEIKTSLVPCGPNQYRSPETNRCRLVVTTTSTLKPCADNEYRSEETGRCRKLPTADSELKPCAEDEYRNPETNRCRKIVQVETLPHPNQMSLKVSSENTGYIFLVGLTLGSVGYGVFEWRDEIRKLIKKLSTIVRK